MNAFEQMAHDANNGVVIDIGAGEEARVLPYRGGKREIQNRKRGGKWSLAFAGDDEEDNAEQWAKFRAAAEDACPVPEVVRTPDHYTGADVAAAWHRAVNGLKEVVRFGAMLMEVDSNLAREKTGKLAGGWGPGDGLKAWLDEHAPEVNYKTAMRFKRLAQAALAGSAQGLDAPMNPGEATRLLGTGGGELSANEAEKRRVLESFLEGRSQRDLWAEAMRAPGRPKGIPGGQRRALTAAERTEDAGKEINELLGRLAAYAAGPKLQALPQEMRQRAATHLKDLAKTFLEKG